MVPISTLLLSSSVPLLRLSASSPKAFTDGIWIDPLSRVFWVLARSFGMPLREAVLPVLGHQIQSERVRLPSYGADARGSEPDLVVGFSLMGRICSTCTGALRVTLIRF